MNNSAQHTLLIMAGGTGGHIFPAIAVAHVARARGWKILWLGNPDGMEARIVPQHQLELIGLRFAAVRGKGWRRKLLLPFHLLAAVYAAWRILQQYRPDAVLGMGGYISFPGAVAAKLCRRPLLIHEQNAIAGLANRSLARFANKALTGFPHSLPGAIWAGNPVRPEIAALPPPEARFANRAGALRVLVIGGSLGARVLNETVPQALALLPVEQRPQVIHQAGAKQFDALAALYARLGVTGELMPFIEDMAAQYEQADLVICRAGAMTIAELAAAGVGSILVPLPHAVDDHQSANATFLAQNGAAMIMPQSQLSAESLAAELAARSRSDLRQMAICARRQCRAGAAERVADACAEALAGAA